jgi:hypothetical protein
MRLRPAALIAALSFPLLVSACASNNDRQTQVAQRGAQVMPFDLELTTHVFDPLDDGGLQKVLVKDPNNSQQIELIRQHLSAEAEKFGRGDFSDPAKIHGHDMPGLAELEGGASQIEIRYSSLPDGGQISYRTKHPALVDAIHRWFAAQRADHGHHAMQHMEHMHH